MNIKEIEQQFTTSERAVIKRFLTLVNDTATKNSSFANSTDIESLNQFSEMSEETDEQITQSVKDWLKLKKVRLRGNQTSN
jgi:mRNA degradation ribonuclease J1/J2